MKKFKKKHTKIPSKEVVMRLLARDDPEGALLHKYNSTFERTPTIIPEPIRVACLAEFDPCRRQNIRYYPDLHNFRLYEVPNRSLPVDKFLGAFRSFIDPAEADKLLHDLTAYRLEFITTPEGWVNAYMDDSGGVKSCMTNSPLARCYAHPQNKLALAVLYAPGGMSVVARTIVNTDEKWYVRLFGDELLVKKLNEQGYFKLNTTPGEFRMYGHAGTRYTPGSVHMPYLDFSCLSNEVQPTTHNPDTGLIEVIINRGIVT
jgi:hypothetical protein